VQVAPLLSLIRHPRNIRHAVTSPMSPTRFFHSSTLGGETESSDDIHLPVRHSIVVLPYCGNASFTSEYFSFNAAVAAAQFVLFAPATLSRYAYVAAMLSTIVARSALLIVFC